MIKLSQKRTCNNCKAINESFNFCLLGYNFNEQLIPSEPCPKPLTVKELCEYMQWYKKQ